MEDRAIVRKFTKPVDVDLGAKTLNGFPYVEKVTGAPILEQAVAYIDCELRERLTAGNHTFFVGRGRRLRASSRTRTRRCSG